MSEMYNGIELPDGALIADGYDRAITGYRDGKVVYDYYGCVDILMEGQGWDYDMAIEWMEFNVVSSYVGEKTPIFEVDGEDPDDSDEEE